MNLRPFEEADAEAVIALWRRCGLTRPWNDPVKDVQRKQLVQRELFLVGFQEGRLVAAVMAGYDGHRGSVNYLAVDPGWRGRGLGRELMEAIESRLLARGCPKINLLVRTDNAEVLDFYAALGYRPDAVSCLGKRLIPDLPPDSTEQGPAN